MESWSPAAQVVIAVIPIVGIVFGCLIVFFSLLWRHKHITLLIKAGNYIPPRFNLLLFSLLTGLLLTGVGLVLSILFYMIEGISYQMLGGLIPCILGVCLVVFYIVSTKTQRSDKKTDSSTNTQT